MINLSLDGLAFETHAWVHTGRSYTLKISQGDEELRLEGEVVWCHLVGTKKAHEGEVLPLYRAGVHFGEALSGSGQSLLGFLHRNAIIQLETRVFGRFRVSPEASLEIDSEHEFLVRRMSLAGMLIEARFLPELEARCRMEVDLGDRRFRTHGRVASLKRLGEDEDGRPHVEMGIEFVELSGEDRGVLAMFVEERLARAST